jgi:excisionase family DNA binding protein
METNKKASNPKRITQIKKMPDILKVSEISAILDCSEYFVRKLIRENKVSGVYCGHGYRVTKKSLINYLEGGAA